MELLHGYTHSSQEAITILRNHKFYFVPMLNVDGLFTISDIYKRTNRLVLKRKNNNPSNDVGYKCKTIDQGVDINRNYDWDFGDGPGSSD